MDRGLEALLLGLSVGVACVASCGAVLVPWLVAQQRTVAATGWLLAQVLAGRLAGYLLFATLAWAAGAVLVPGEAHARMLVYGLVYVALAAVLGWYAASRHTSSDASAVRPGLEPGTVRPGLKPGTHEDEPVRRASTMMRLRLRVARLGPAGLGFLTGVAICPPFVVASIRAAQLRSLPASLGFFSVFFLGTSIWFLPFIAAGLTRRMHDARTVARIAMVVVAAYYGYLGIVALGWRVLYG